MTSNEGFRLPNTLPFPDCPYRSITGEQSTLHRIILHPKERKQHRALATRRHSITSQRETWTDVDKANLVKIFSDASIDADIKRSITDIVAVSEEELARYRERLQIYGLRGLAHDFEEKKHKPSKLERFGVFEIDRATGDIRRNGGVYELLPPIILRIFNVFLLAPADSVITTDALSKQFGLIHKDIARRISLLAHTLQNMSGKRHFKNTWGKGYQFSPTGFVDSDTDFEDSKE